MAIAPTRQARFCVSSANRILDLTRLRARAIQVRAVGSKYLGFTRLALLYPENQAKDLEERRIRCVLRTNLLH